MMRVRCINAYSSTSSSFLRYVRRNNNNYPRRIRIALGFGARIFEPFEMR